MHVKIKGGWAGVGGRGAGAQIEIAKLVKFLFLLFFCLRLTFASESPLLSSYRQESSRDEEVLSW